MHHLRQIFLVGRSATLRSDKRIGIILSHVLARVNPTSAAFDHDGVVMSHYGRETCAHRGAVKIDI
ncbi:hypothetical protein CHELA1G11_10012 [Hyphomicrobiales bacterium]|nr:hypothetical protein CHELA1G11_10012 [Hyphomicrobiales bacterium]